MANKLTAAIIFLVLALSVSGCTFVKNDKDITKEQTMKLVSKNFNEGEAFPEKFTCDGEKTAPNLSWSDFPAETKSFALIMEDPDAPSGTFVHWLMINIPAAISELPEGITSLAEATMIKNSSGQSDYVPPCPPTGAHRYIFKIFALKTEELDGVKINNFFDTIKPYIIDQATLGGKYGRN